MRGRWDRKQVGTYAAVLAVLVAVVGLAWVCARLVFPTRPDAGGSAVAARQHARTGGGESGQAAAPSSEGVSAGAAIQVRVGGATLYGSVSLSDGRPAVGATVTVQPMSRPKKVEPGPASARSKSPPATPAPVQVGADGRYAFEHLPPGRCFVTATDNRHRDATLFSQLQEGGSEKLDLVLKDATKLAGHVRDPSDAPLAGMHVSSAWPKREVVTGADGSFEISGFNPGLAEASLTVRDPTGSFGTARVEASFDDKDLVVVLRPAARIAGQVVDSRTEAGLEGAAVVVASEGGGVLALLARLRDPSARTDASGRFEVGALASGTYERQVAHPAYAHQTATVRVAAGETQELTIRLDAGATVAGRVLDGQSGLGVPGAVVADATDLQTAGPFGPAQMMELQVTAAMRSTGEAAWIGAAEKQLQAAFAKQGIPVAVAGADGALVKGAAVTAVRTSDRDDPILSRRRAEATTDELGRFTLRPLDTVDYEVEATLGGKGVTRQRVSLSRTDRTGLELRLAVTGTIRARVVDPNGHPVSDVTIIAVTLSPQDR